MSLSHPISSDHPEGASLLVAPIRIVIAHWWRSVDRLVLSCTLALLIIGILLSFAAGPASASRIPGINDSFHFVNRHLIFIVPSLLLMLGASFLPPLIVRRSGVFFLLIFLTLLLFTLISGHEINGARRWIDLRYFGLQPSEFIKPAFIMFVAWMLAESVRDKTFPGALLAMLVYGGISGILFLQPDYGQWFLLTVICGMMFFFAGWNWRWMAALGALGGAGMGAGYVYLPHVKSRIDRFLDPSTGDNYQVEKAIEALKAGGLFGREATAQSAGVKYQLPDSHSDFIFAVAGEEFGLIFCALIMLLYAIIVFRAFYAAARLSSVFSRCAVCGLAAQIGLQAMINMSVSLRLLPAKGMTLPFVSYGGSSLLASALGIGFLLALTRKNIVTFHDKERVL